MSFFIDMNESALKALIFNTEFLLSLFGEIYPSKVLMNVVFPDPLDPNSPTISFFLIFIVISDKTFSFSKVRLRFSTSSMFSPLIISFSVLLAPFIK